MSEDVLPLIKEGADCFYFGVNRNVIFGNTAGPLNRRPWKFANFNSLEDVQRAIDLVKTNGREINFALNEHFYSPKQILKAIKFIRKIRNIDGIIIADLGLVLRIRKELPQINLIASTGMHIQNRSAIDFYRQLGIKKIVLPRHFTLEEIESLTKKYCKIDFEVFIINEDCANIDGLCCYSHGVFDTDKIANPCQLLCGISPFYASGRKNNKEKTVKDFSKCRNFLFSHCGVCHIPYLKKIGIKSLKIVGRTLPAGKIAKDIEFVRYGIEKSGFPQLEFRKNLFKKHKEIYHSNCSKKCFYLFEA